MTKISCHFNVASTDFRKAEGAKYVNNYDMF